MKAKDFQDWESGGDFCSDALPAKTRHWPGQEIFPRPRKFRRRRKAKKPGGFSL